MTSRNRLFAVVTLPVCAAIFLAGARFATAGDLDPPAGPVAPTHKTLTEVEPRIAINATNTPGDDDSLFQITQPGSYYLTGNIAGVVGKHGIEIAAGGVTLDLNGFDLVGVPAMGFFDGVSVTVAGLTNIAVVNGSVRDWGDEGVDLASVGVNNCRVADVLASGNTGTGIFSGTNSTVTNCSAFQNAANGINTGNGGTITNCSAHLNAATGIVTGSGATVLNCSAYQNTNGGISTGSGCTVTNCSAIENTGSGISTGIGCTVTNCSAYDNAGSGILTGTGGTVTNCSTAQNTSSGISVAAGSTVADCTARTNTLDGIACTTQCVIRGNTCSFNGNGGDGAGIHAISSDNRIEGNSCTLADRGIDVDAAGNLIIRNSASGNIFTNYDIVAGNRYGPIIDITAGGTAAVSGNSAASTVSSTDPWANFAF